MSNIYAYVILIIAVVLGTAANGFAKGAQGFTLLIPSILTAITIVGCMYTLSLVMKTIPVGITYASFAGLCIIATSIVGGSVQKGRPAGLLHTMSMSFCMCSRSHAKRSCYLIAAYFVLCVCAHDHKRKVLAI